MRPLRPQPHSVRRPPEPTDGGTRTAEPSPTRASTAVPTARPRAAWIWWHAARPNTLPAALAGVVVGLGAAHGGGASFRVDTAFGCVAVALLLQVLANFANDLSDFRRGVDTPDRQGPTRVAAAGYVTERELEVAIAVTIAMAGAIGLWLAWEGGPILIGLGVLAMIAALAYTGGPWPYGYRGLGELSVFVFFGLVAVVGTAYLQAGRLEPVFFAAALPPGLLITTILVVNNLRDIPTDATAGRRTLAVRLGERATKAEYALFIGLAFATPVALVLAGWSPILLLTIAAVPGVIPLWRTVNGFHERRELNRVLRGTAWLSLLVSVLFAIGLGAGPR